MEERCNISIKSAKLIAINEDIITAIKSHITVVKILNIMLLMSTLIMLLENIICMVGFVKTIRCCEGSY